MTKFEFKVKDTYRFQGESGDSYVIRPTASSEWALDIEHPFAEDETYIGFATGEDAFAFALETEGGELFEEMNEEDYDEYVKKSLAR